MSTERRLHAPQLPSEGGELRLGKEAAHHAAVLRLAVGDELTLFDGEGMRAAAVLLELGKDALRLRVSTPTRVVREGAPTLLIQGLPRGGKLDDLVRAATELGVDEIRLAVTDHSMARADDERADKRRERLERVVREAARQSERDGLPVLGAAAPLERTLAGLPEGAIGLAFCGRSGAPLGRLDPARPVVAVIGPEGGLSTRELELLDRHGFTRVSLGSTILRVETAVVAAISAVAQARRDGDPAPNR